MNCSQASNACKPTTPGPTRPVSPTSLSRGLIEEYWRSVGHGGELAASHRPSNERGDGAKYSSFVTRREGIQKLIATSLASSADPVQWCLDQSDAAEAAGQFAEAKKYLRAALEQLQRNNPALMEMANSVTQNFSTNVEHVHVRAALILCRLGKLSMRQGEYEMALSIFTLSNRIDPLAPSTYALRGACHEYLENYAEAYEEYKKYLSLNEPTMAVMAHTSQCALKAGQYEAAERHLYEMLQLTKVAAASAPPHSGNVLNPDESPSFYQAHAYYCLGLVRDEQAAHEAATIPEGSKNLTVEQLSQEALGFYELALANSAYVAALEDAAESAIARQDASLALENLRHLQNLRRNYAQYYSRAADVYAMINDPVSEVVELSKALDQRQTVPTTRQTLLRRAALYASKLGNLDNAIVDLSLLLSLPGDDYCTAMAYMQRAKAFERRSCERIRTSREDVGAALRDYNSFVEAALRRPQRMSVLPEYITEAMLILANGAFKEKNYDCAARFFARAVARGWQPRECLPQGRQTSPKTSNNSPLPESLSSSISLENVDLLTKMYVAIAHTIVVSTPIAEDMFKVPYEQREKHILPVVLESKKSKAAERKEAEKPAVAVPAVGYQVVEEHYQKLRALEPTVFSSLQYELLELWEPYRTEVERQREDLMLSRAGRKVKRR